MDRFTAVTKRRMILESVPYKQITLAHIIANPDDGLRKKLGIDGSGEAIVTLTVTPREASFIVADIAVEKGDIRVLVLDRFTGSLILSGELSAIESAVEGTLEWFRGYMGFTVPPLTRT